MAGSGSAIQSFTDHESPAVYGYSSVVSGQGPADQRICPAESRPLADWWTVIASGHLRRQTLPSAAVYFSPGQPAAGSCRQVVTKCGADRQPPPHTAHMSADAPDHRLLNAHCPVITSGVPDHHRPTERRQSVACSGSLARRGGAQWGAAGISATRIVSHSYLHLRQM